MCTHACTKLHSHTCTHTIPMTSTTFTGLVTTTVPVPEMSSCGGGYLMEHGYILLAIDSVPPHTHTHTHTFFSSPFLPSCFPSSLPILLIWCWVIWFELLSVGTVIKACSSSFDGSEPLPRWKRFKKVVCRVSGVRDYGCGFAKRAGCVD